MNVLYPRFTVSTLKYQGFKKNPVSGPSVRTFEPPKTGLTDIIIIPEVRNKIINLLKDKKTYGFWKLASKLKVKDLSAQSAQERYMLLIDAAYNLIRMADYSKIAPAEKQVVLENGASIGINTFLTKTKTQNNQLVENIFDKTFRDQKFKIIVAQHHPGWYYRYPQTTLETFNTHFYEPAPTKERISLNVRVCKALIDQLDDLWTYPNPPKGMYKVCREPQAMDSRHDPITIYLDEPLTEAMVNRLVKVVSPFVRSTEDVLPGRCLAPGISLENYPTQEELKALYESGNQLSPAFGEAILDYVYRPEKGKYNAGTGIVHAIHQVMDLIQQMTE